MKKWSLAAAGVVISVLTVGIAIPAASASNTLSYEWMNRMMGNASATPQGIQMIQQCDRYMSQWNSSQAGP